MSKKTDKYLEKALMHISIGDYKKAIEEYKNIIVLQPGDHKAYQMLGECYLKTENLPNSTIFIKTWHKPEIYLYRGLARIGVSV